MSSRQVARTIQDRAITALRTEFGADVYVKPHPGSFTARDVTLKFTFTPGGADAKEDADRIAFKQFAPLVDLKPSYFGQQFERKGQFYTVKAIKPGRAARPVIAEREDGKQFAFPAALIDAILGTAI